MLFVGGARERERERERSESAEPWQGWGSWSRRNSLIQRHGWANDCCAGFVGEQLITGVEGRKVAGSSIAFSGSCD